MAQNTIDLYVAIDGGPDTDEYDLIEFVSQITKELNKVDSIESAEQVREGELPEGAKGLPPAAAKVLITLAKASGVTALINVFGPWLSRDRSRTLKLQLGDSTLELSGLSKDEQQELTEWFQTQAGIRL